MRAFMKRVIPCAYGGTNRRFIELEHVSKVYRNEGALPCQALEDVSLTVGYGEFVGIIGSSGSGKSTLMRIIGCEERPTEGVYRFGGASLERCSERELCRLRSHHIAVIPQQYHQWEEDRVWENVAAPLDPRRHHLPQRREQALRALEQVGLADRADRRPEELSGGQQQRVAIARTLVQRPDMVLADEPTAALDMEAREEVFRLLQAMSEAGMTVLLITHDLNLAVRTRRLVRIHQGQICEDRQLGCTA